jgi:quercetin dioxygenase-like cupin family protein
MGTYFAGNWDGPFNDDGSHDYGLRAAGYGRRTLVGANTGAVHTELGLCRLAPGGYVDRHVHSFEKCAYVLTGTPVVEVGSQSYELAVGYYVLFPVGSAHAWHNLGAEEACWLEMSTPQSLPPAASRSDTFFLPADGHRAQPRRPNLADPTLTNLGYYLGTPPQVEALAVSGPARGRGPVGMDTALLAYSGISVKMLVDSNMGADLLTMFMVDYEPGGAAQVHDHPFEEAYFFLEGEIEADIDGEPMTFHGGEFLFCGVGVVHGFFNMNPGRMRWIETQAPQPPRRHSYRWPTHWERFSEQLSNGARPQ